METVGSLIDKLSINELKIYHMKEQINRTDKDDVFKNNCKSKLEVLNMQREDLSNELSQLLENIVNGKKKIKIYRQMKMYNDKQYKD